MKLCYQVATPDVAIAPSVTAYQGDLATSLSDLSKMGYDGVEFMTINPSKLNWHEVRTLLDQTGLDPILVCTGEIFGQLRYSFTDPDKKIREAAVEKVYEMIDFAEFLGAKTNIGRVRGSYRDDVLPEQTEEWAIESFRKISDYAAPKNVQIALESVTHLQTNFINTLAESADIIDRVDRPNFRMMMDIFHMNIEEKSICDCIAKYRPYNIHVHLADNNRKYPGNCGLDIESVIKAFRESGYDGTFCTEIMQMPDQTVSAQKSIEFLAPLFHKYYGREIK